MSDTAEVLWWVFLATFLAVVVLVGGLGIAMVRAHQRVVALHRSYLQRLVRAHEEERSRVAREVHDDAVQRLVYLGRELEMQREDDARDDVVRRRRLDGLRAELQDLADTLRQLAHQLHPAALEHAGLNVALSQLVDEIRRLHQLDVDLRLPEHEPALDPHARLALFRIAQEALRNTVRHAAARRALVDLRVRDRQVEIVVEDDGRGFAESDSRMRGIGLVGIQERAHLVGGNATVTSSPGAGTRVSARVSTVPR